MGRDVVIEDQGQIILSMKIEEKRNWSGMNVEWLTVWEEHGKERNFCSTKILKDLFVQNKGQI